MAPSDAITIRALREDLALQLARHIKRGDQSQVRAARQLGIPQPTLSKIMRGRVQELSLELLLRIAVRAGLPVTLQTGKHPAEAGAYVSGSHVEAPESTRTRSRLAELSRADLTESARRLTPVQRLEAHVRHSELVAQVASVSNVVTTTPNRSANLVASRRWAMPNSAGRFQPRVSASKAQAPRSPRRPLIAVTASTRSGTCRSPRRAIVLRPRCRASSGQGTGGIDSVLRPVT